MICDTFPAKVQESKWIDTRDAVMHSMIELAGHDERIVVLDADVSKTTRSRQFGQEHPNRYFNVGIAELHMASMAAAMAADGMRPYICSFATFLALRALEPIRTQIAYPALPAVLVGGYAGLSAMQHGPTHQCLVDLAIYNALQGMTVLSPSDSVSAAELTAAAAGLERPVYLRIGYNTLPPLYVPGQVKIGDCYRLRSGSDALLLSTGLSTHCALEAARLLEAKGIQVGVVDFPTIKPFPAEDIAVLSGSFPCIFTVEEHVGSGGLYTQVLSALNQYGVRTKVVGIHMGDRFAESAPLHVLQQKYGLDGPGIARAVADTLFCS